MKTAQIPYELFVDLVLYHLNSEDDFDEEIRQGLEQKLTALAKEGVTSRGEIRKLQDNVQYYRERYYDSATALETMKNRYNELKEKCKPYLEAMEHFPELVRSFIDKVRELFIVKEAQKQAEKEAKEKARQERIKTRRNKRGMER